MLCSAILVAAGSGTRLGVGEPKAFVKLHGRAMLHYSLAALAKVPAIAEVVVAIPTGMERRTRDEVARAGLEVPVKITPGYLERQDCALRLALTSAEAEVIPSTMRPAPPMPPFLADASTPPPRAAPQSPPSRFPIPSSASPMARLPRP
jgi:hypothetical protein